MNDCLKLQEDLDRICNAAQLWHMELNSEKTELLTIGNSRFRNNKVLNGNVICRASFMNDVGVIVQSDLKFTKHCANVVKKAYYIIRNIFMATKYHNHDFYKKMYICYVRPVLEYASQVWSPVLKGNIDKIEKVLYKMLCKYS